MGKTYFVLPTRLIAKAPDAWAQSACPPYACYRNATMRKQFYIIALLATGLKVVLKLNKLAPFFIFIEIYFDRVRWMAF